MCERLDDAEKACGAVSVQPSGQTNGSTVARPAIRITSKVATHCRISSVYSQPANQHGGTQNGKDQREDAPEPHVRNSNEHTAA